MLNLITVLVSTVAFAQWSSDPAQSQMLGSGIAPQVQTTADGGAYVAWLTDMNNYQVYLQRLDSNGDPAFDEGGLLVSDHNNASWIAVFHMNLDVDSQNNAIITVLDERDGPWNVYAYKIAPDGTMLWGADGLAVSDSNVTNYSPRLSVMSDDSVVVTWHDDSSHVYFQRVSANGDLMWGDGIEVTDSSEALMSPQPTVDGNGNALIQWIGQSGPFWAADSTIHLQQYGLDGIQTWSDSTIAAGPTVFPMGNWLQESVTDESGGSFSGWTQMAGNVQNAKVQHINANGELSWLGGVALSIDSSVFRISPRLAVSDDSQQLMAVFHQSNANQSQRGIYAQRLDQDGNRLWGSSGTAVAPLDNSVYYDLVIAGVGEDMITAYIQDNTVSDIYAARLNADGDFVWGGDGSAVVTNSGASKSDLALGASSGRLVMAWSENGDIHAHCLGEDGILGAPVVDNVAGDTNGDGMLNVVDIVATVYLVLEAGPFNVVADVNSDGVINVVDVVMMVNMVLNA